MRLYIQQQLQKGLCIESNSCRDCTYSNSCRRLDGHQQLKETVQTATVAWDCTYTATVAVNCTDSNSCRRLYRQQQLQETIQTTTVAEDYTDSNSCRRLYSLHSVIIQSEGNISFPISCPGTAWQPSSIIALPTLTPPSHHLQTPPSPHPHPTITSLPNPTLTPPSPHPYPSFTSPPNPTLTTPSPQTHTALTPSSPHPYLRSPTLIHRNPPSFTHIFPLSPSLI